MRDIIKILPQYDYVYLGDNARVPYGDRSAEAIYEFTRQAVEFLFTKNCHLVILACNSATASALRKIQQEFLPDKFPSRRVLGVILPTVEAIVESKFKRVGVISTYATITSNSFAREIYKLDPNIRVFQQACPLLVPIIEEGELKWQGLEMILRKYLEPLLKNNIDSLILGCTHYGLIEKTVEKLVGDRIKVISEGELVGQKLKTYLKKHKEIGKQLCKKSRREYYVTDLNERYLKLINFFLKEKLNNIKVVVLK